MISQVTSRSLSAHDDILHTFTTRLQGSSSRPFHSNNIAFHVGDKRDDVRKNHALLAKYLSYDLRALVHMRQIHSDRIVIVDDTFTFDDPPECDALITNIKEKPLMVMTADCTPVLLYDPLRKVIAAIHAGRAGAFKDIVTKSVHKMQDVFACEPRDILAVLGPSIGSCCYEVDSEVYQEATTLGLAYAMEKRAGHYFLDVNAILRKRLFEAGVKAEHFEDLTRCNACENDVFFSYRADGKQTGRMAGIIALRR